MPELTELVVTGPVCSEKGDKMVLMCCLSDLVPRRTLDQHDQWWQIISSAFVRVQLLFADELESALLRTAQRRL